MQILVKGSREGLESLKTSRMMSVWLAYELHLGYEALKYWSRTMCLCLSSVDMLSWIILVLCIPGLYSLDTSCTFHLLGTAKYVSRQCQMSPRGSGGIDNLPSVKINGVTWLTEVGLKGPSPLLHISLLMEALFLWTWKEPLIHTDPKCLEETAVIQTKMNYISAPLPKAEEGGRITKK